MLEEKLIELNPGLITADNVDEVIRRIEVVRNTIEGNAEILYKTLLPLVGKDSMVSLADELLRAEAR